MPPMIIPLCMEACNLLRWGFCIYIILAADIEIWNIVALSSARGETFILPASLASLDCLVNHRDEALHLRPWVFSSFPV